MDKLSFLSMLAALLSASALVMTVVEASCTVKNNSGHKVLILPVDVSVTIEVDVGTSLEVPVREEHCSFKNAATGHELGPVTLTDGTLVVIVDGSVSATVDIYVASLLSGILQLGASIVVSL